MDKVDKITIYDQDNQRVGETYQRRAKQLVLKNRAKWMDDDFSAICLTNAEDDFNEDNKEDEMIYHNNGNIVETHEPAHELEEGRSPLKPSRDLLMYLAERNIRFRSNLIRHIAAYIVAFPVMVILTNGFHHRDFGNFFAGIMFAWAMLIAYKMFEAIRSWFARRQLKNPLTAEYERLKSMPSEGLPYEYKRL